jgi:hypothetical protein
LSRAVFSLSLTEGAAPGFFGNGWFQPFSIINLYGVTSLISWLEILFLNSIKRQAVSLAHYSQEEFG